MKLSCIFSFWRFVLFVCLLKYELEVGRLSLNLWWFISYSNTLFCSYRRSTTRIRGLGLADVTNHHRCLRPQPSSEGLSWGPLGFTLHKGMWDFLGSTGKKPLPPTPNKELKAWAGMGKLTAAQNFFWSSLPSVFSIDGWT